MNIVVRDYLVELVPEKHSPTHAGCP